MKNLVKSAGFNLVKTICKRYGYTPVENWLLYDWQKRPLGGASHAKCILPECAYELTPRNKFLVDLQNRYAAMSTDVTTPLYWVDGCISEQEMRYFRGDNAYVFQLRGKLQENAYALTAYYVKSIDSLGLLDRLVEDGAFGVYTFDVCGLTVSRDLLDSVIEAYLLDKYFGIFNKPTKILDIGAGYGRLAHRLTTATDLVDCACTDAVPVSTFLCDFYTKYRETNAVVVPLDEVEKYLSDNQIDIAVNIHSFSECQPSAIDWWVSQISRAGVKNLVIAPDSVSDNGGSELFTCDHRPFADIVSKHGYKLVDKTPKYSDPMVQQYGVNATHYFIFELS